MASGYVDTTWMGGAELASPPVEIRKAETPPATLPTAVTGTTDDFSRRYANEGRNSRMNITLKKGNWEIAWTLALPARLPSSLLLRWGDRIVVEGTVEWYLCDTSGKHLATGNLAPGGITIDGPRGVFYLMNSSGYMSARRLSDGSPAFLMEIDFGSNFMHPFIVARDHFLMATGIERRLNPHGVTPQTSNLQLLDMGSPQLVDDDQVLKSFHTVRTLRRKTTDLAAAANANNLVVSTDNRIYFVDGELKLQKALNGEFTPLAMSIDELGNVYLVIRRPRGERALTGISPQGETFCDTPIFGSFGSRVDPPIIGFDHTIYIIFRDRVQAVGADGTLLWNTHAGGEIAGAVVMPDGMLLVAAGNLLLTFDRAGERSIIASFPGEALCSQPLPGSASEIYVATEDKLYKLNARKD